MRVIGSVAAWVSIGLLLCWWSVACGPAAAPPPVPTAGDPFAVVRATAQAAYTSGKAHLDRGEFLQACVDLDTAKTDDPDNRPEIDQALNQALQRCLTPVAEATSAPAQRLPTLALATLQAAATIQAQFGASAGTAVAAQATRVGTTSGAAPPESTSATTMLQPTPATTILQPTPAATILQPNPVAATLQPVPAAASRPNGVASPVSAAAANDLVTWNDPQGRFSLGVPADWTATPQPQSLFGTSVVQFRDPSDRAEVDLAVDTNARAVSPELYAASMELAMQQQVPGYATEQVLPGSTAGNPSVRRVFTFTQRDANGQDHQARAFQVTLVKGSTPYIIAGSSPAEQFQQFGPTFDRMVESFRFS
jgi:hypothetical protein